MTPTYQYNTVVTGEPAVEPVTLAEAKIHLRVDGDDENTYMETLITAARMWAEGVTRRKFINTTVRLSLDVLPDVVRLPFGKTQSITTFAYTDEDGNAATLPSGSTGYTLDSDSEPARIVPYYDTDWPTTYEVNNAIQITYVVGYGAAATSVPAKIKQAILMYCLHLYERDGATEGVVETAENLLRDYRILEFF